MSQDVEYVLRARDDASAVVANVLRRFEGIDAMLTKISQIGAGAGAFGVTIGALVGIGSAAYASATRVTDMVEQLERAQSVTGVSAEQLQVMQRVLKEGGGDWQNLDSMLAKFNRELQQGNPLLERIGVTSKDTFTAFMQLAGAITSSTDAKARDEVAARLLGKSGEALIADLENLTGKFDSTNAAMKRTGLIMGEDMRAQVALLDQQMDTLSRNWDGALQRMELSAAPVLNNLISMFNDMWDAALGVDKNPNLAQIDRKIAEVEERMRRRLNQDNNPGQRLNPFTFVNESYIELAKIQRELRAERDRLVGGSDSAARVRRLRDGGADSDLAAALRDRPKPGPAGPQQIPALNPATGAAWGGITGPRDRTAADIMRAADAETWAKLAKKLELARVTGLRLGDAMQMVSDQEDASRVALYRMRTGVETSISSAVDAVTHGSMRIDLAFQSLMKAIEQEVASSLLKMGVGLGLEALGFATGQPWLVAIGQGVSGVPGGTPGQGGAKQTAAGPASITYNISTLNARDLVMELTAPGGQLRQANDRVRDLARAQVA